MGCASTLPLELPIKGPTRTWGQRVKAVFTEPVKLPGWAAVLFVAVQSIPDWKSRFDFWVDVAKQTGGYLPDASSRTYVEELAKVFLDSKWKITANCFFSDVRPDLTGFYVGISPALKGKNLDDFPQNIRTIVKVINDAKINAQWAFDKGETKEDVFSIVVGNAP